MGYSVAAANQPKSLSKNLEPSGIRPMNALTAPSSGELPWRCSSFLGQRLSDSLRQGVR